MYSISELNPETMDSYMRVFTMYNLTRNIVTSYSAVMDISRGRQRISPAAVAMGPNTSSDSLSVTFKSNAGSSLTSGMLYDTSAYIEKHESCSFMHKSLLCDKSE